MLTQVLTCGSITYVFALHTEDSCDPLLPKGRPTQQTARLSVATCRLLDIVQATGKTPVSTCKWT